MREAATIDVRLAQVGRYLHVIAGMSLALSCIHGCGAEGDAWPRVSPQRTISGEFEQSGSNVGPDRAGYALGLYYENDGADYEALLWEAARVGARSINVIVMREQADVADSTIEVSERYSPSDDDVRRVVTYARALDLEVVVMPVVFVKQRGPGLWRGTLEPKDPAKWWESYEDFILHYADLTSELGVSWFVVGSELGSMESDTVRWANLIAEVRLRTDASITYSANWDRFDAVPFWNRLDGVGVSLYEPVVGQSPEQWAESIRTTRARIEARAEHLDAEILITEFGFPSRASAGRRPWDTLGSAGVDLAIQDTLLRELLGTWCGSERIRHIFIWNYADGGGGLDSDYSPRRKPAESVLDDWYRCDQGTQ